MSFSLNVYVGIYGPKGLEDLRVAYLQDSPALLRAAMGDQLALVAMCSPLVAVHHLEAENVTNYVYPIKVEDGIATEGLVVGFMNGGMAACLFQSDEFLCIAMEVNECNEHLPPQFMREEGKDRVSMEMCHGLLERAMSFFQVITEDREKVVFMALGAEEV